VIIKSPHEHDPHWSASAELFVSGAIAATVAFADEEDRHLQTVRSILTNKERLQGIIKLMCESDKFGGMLARLGGQMAQFEGKELQSVLTTSNRNLNFLDSPKIAHSTRTSSFDPEGLLTGKMSIFLTIRPSTSAASRRWPACG